MSQQSMVTHKVGFGCGVALRAVQSERRCAPPWRCDSLIVATNCEYVWLVHRAPVLDSIPKLSETNLCIGFKILSVESQLYD